MIKIIFFITKILKLNNINNYVITNEKKYIKTKKYIKRSNL